MGNEEQNLWRLDFANRCAVNVGIFHLCSRNLAPELWPILLFYRTNEVPTMMTAVHNMSKNRMERNPIMPTAVSSPPFPRPPAARWPPELPPHPR